MTESSLTARQAEIAKTTDPNAASGNLRMSSTPS